MEDDAEDKDEPESDRVKSIPVVLQMRRAKPANSQLVTLMQTLFVLPQYAPVLVVKVRSFPGRLG